MKNKYQKKFTLSLTIGLFLCLFYVEKIEAKIELLDRVVAVVDSGVVMESQLNQRVQDIIGRLRSDGIELPPKEVLEEQILERLIIEEIQLQIGDQAGVKISDAELNRALSMIASENSMNLEQFKESLDANNDSYVKLRDQVRKELIIQRVQRGKVGANIEISEQEIENFLNSEEGRSKLAEQYNVQQILLSLSSSAPENEVNLVKEKGADLIERYKEGESFEKLAATYSSDQNALEGGSLGWRKSSELPSLFSNVVVKMKVGEISELIRSGAGFHIIRLSEKRGDVVKFEDQTLVRHILIQSSEIRSENQTKELINEIHQELIDGEDFKQLARQHSEDPGSKMEGGELGWSSPDSFDPAFEAVMNSVDIGEMSKPFQSSFGWHILEVLDRRNEDISDDVRKNRAYSIIFNRKFEQELQRTLIELRSESYVDIKLNT
ncbi:MAG: peptidylprolyl isomerase [SAR86 cluster bacterium]|jgi:peptidyl-prolyl cis-trans isomerase SurA|nr:peptidylprolyl isomerase [SAR86 cluster bacterium]|tara:strand:- start:1291 stop:2601 length:1311 start_codon:yes stop_codon:yes gene_type:complete